ncbi:DUF1735 domain-containing protein [Lacinutrix sp. Hel_I_90]|uniref:DUF1735 domain-containing protein n=1 Tax=Lacinutrix sp. Hel_I_90 TaxID=1249999 RepID=UPI0005CB30A7|nr:DUF1735 domain-containing protein [Lacinutrix sp. Hel_I_90]
MKKIAFIIISCLLIASCGEQETPQYDVNNSQSLIQFESNISILELSDGGQAVIEIPLSVSTYAPSDRTVNVEVTPITGTNLTPANPNQYSFNGVVTIPANELKGNLTFTIDSSGLESDETLTVQFEITSASFDNISIVDQTHTLKIIQICPIPENYLVGTYLLNSPLANISCGGPLPSFIGDNVEVEVSIGESQSKRVFEARYAPGSCDGFNGPFEFVIDLSCGGTALLSNQVITDLSCNGITNITVVNDPNRPSTYDINDDTSITINVIDDINGSCNSVPFENQSFTLTKL